MKRSASQLSVAFSPQSVLFSPQDGWNRQVPVEVADEFSQSCFCLSLASALLYITKPVLPIYGGVMQRVGLVIFASVVFWIGSTTSGSAQPATQDLIAGALQACHDGRIATDRATRAAAGP